MRQSPLRGRGLPVACLVVACATGCMDLARLWGPGAGTGASAPAGGDPAILARLGLEAREVGQDASGILAKNSSKFAGAVRAPQEIVAKNSSKFRLSGLVEVPLADAWVALLTPDGLVYAVGGKPSVTRTDAGGGYDLGIGLPAGSEVVVAAFVADGAHTLCNFTVAETGPNLVDVSYASDRAFRYLQINAQRAGKALSAFDRRKYSAVVGATRMILDEGHLVVSLAHLEKTGRAAGIGAYHAAMQERRPELLAAWRDLLGFEPQAGVPDLAGPVNTTAGTIMREPAGP